VEGFKKHLIRTTLEHHDGNRTHSARSLGLQRTYLLRLMRDFSIRVPIPARFQKARNGE